MTISKNLDRFAGRPVVDFEGSRVSGDVVYRLRQDYDDARSQQAMLDDFFAVIAPAEVIALVIGAWAEGSEHDPKAYLDGLIARRRELVQLSALFVGDITFEENEMSWIKQTDYAGLLKAFPTLETLRVRGSDGLVLPPFEHQHLTHLALETGALPTALVRNLAQSTMPALKHLELWLGDDYYGFDGKVADYQALLEAVDGSRLAYLGLRNAEIADELAQWLAGEAWVTKLQVLDLSMGTLGDVGAQALLDSPHLDGILALNLTHHYIGPELQARLGKRFGPRVLLGDPQEEEEEGERFVEVSE